MPGGFPKTRPELPEDLRRIYASCYKQNRSGGTPASWLSNRAESWLHYRVARDVLADRRYCTTLEIGAGNLNHLPWEPIVGPYDIVEPFTALYEGSRHLGRVRTVYADIGDIPEALRYHRVISIATFEHVCDLPDLVARVGVVLEPGGVLRVSIPSEGTWLWKVGWKLTTGLEFRIRYGLDYGLLMRHEHVNTAREVEEVLRYFFRDVRMSVCGPSRKLSIYQFFRCADPEEARCAVHRAPGTAHREP